MIDYTEALRLVLDQAFDWGTETVPLHRATGRILRQDITADRDQPPFDRVAMDGIALDFTAYAGGRRAFPVSHLAPAGTAPRAVRDAEHCVEVMTGAPLPPGTTTVIRYEDLRREGTWFVVPEGVEDGRSIHRRGSDAKAGELLLSGVRRIGAAEMAVLATYGYAGVRVARWPRVAIASTGDEVVPVGDRPADHQIRSSNVHQLAALFRAVGIEPTLGHLADAPEAGRARLAELIDGHDLLLLSGGVSKGKLDHVPEWLRAAGIARLFHGVAQRPGKPLWVGRNPHTMVFALPGNPVSSLVGTLAYVGPFLRRALGLQVAPERAKLAEAVTFLPDLTVFKSVRLDRSAGEQRAVALSGGGSGDLVSLLGGTGFLCLPRGRNNYAVDELFHYLPTYLL